MRRLCLFLAAVSLCLGTAGHAQSPKPQTTRAHSPAPAQAASPKATAQPSAQAQPSGPTSAARPQFRPAVLVSGRDSLVNRINVDELLKKGQKDGAVQFSAMITADGSPEDIAVYHALPNCEALEQEVQKQLTGAKFTPPIYQYQRVKALLYGTVLFDADATPHLRVFLNQDPRAIEGGTDFIAPQPVVGGDSKFTGLHTPQTLPVKITGVVTLVLQVNTKGEMLAAGVSNEEPPLLGLAEAVAADFEGAKFIPAFRDGDLIDSESITSLCYTPTDEEDASDALNLKLPTPPQP
jgi:hypothetical protein